MFEVSLNFYNLPTLPIKAYAGKMSSEGMESRISSDYPDAFLDI